MPKYFLLFFFNCLLLIQTRAQQQITDFPNEKVPIPLSLQYCGQLNDKVIFLAYKPEYNAVQLWVSDGTQKGTLLLKDSDEPYYVFNNFVACNNQLYFMVSRESTKEVWTTDGTIENTRKVFESDLIREIQKFQDRLMLVFFKRGAEGESKFAWLNDTGELNIWEDNIRNYSIIDNKIHYMVFDSTKGFQLKVYYKEVNPLSTFFKGSAGFYGPIEYQKRFYYYLYNEEKKCILISDLQNPDKNQLLDWTGHPENFIYFVKDTAQSLHLLKYIQGHLQIYKVNKNNTLKEIANINNSNISTVMTTYFGTIQNPVLYKDNLVFTTVLGGEGGTYNLRVHRYRINQNEYEHSDNLIPKFIWDVKIKPRTDDVYELDGLSNNCLYDFNTNKLSGCVSASLTDAYYPRTEIQTKTRTFVFADNLYLITKSKKTPLLQINTIYNPAATEFLHKDTLNNQLLFWTSDQTKTRGQIWAGDGFKTNLIFEYDIPLIYSLEMNTKKRLNHSLVFSVLGYREANIYKTDGTEKGTKQLAHFEYDYIQMVNTDANEKLLIYKIETENKSLGIRDQKLVLINIATEEVTIVDMAALSRSEVYLTSTDVYVTSYIDYNKYAIYGLKNNYLQHITNVEAYYTGNSPKMLFIYKDKLFYTQSMGADYNEIKYIDTSFKSVSYYAGAESFVIYDKYMLAYYKNRGVIIDLKTAAEYMLEKLDSFQQGNIRYQEGKFVFFDAQYLYIYHKEADLQKIAFKERFEILQIKEEGIFISTYRDYGQDRSLLFYNFNTRILKEIVSKNGYGTMVTDEANNVVFIRSGNDSGNIIWDIAKERSFILPDAVNSIQQVTNELMIASKSSDYTNIYILLKQDTVFKEKYRLKSLYHYTYTIGKTDTSIYFSYYDSSKGRELLCLTKDSIYYLPEVVKGKEGAEVKSFFSFKNNMYVVASTYTYGTQVWRLNTSNDVAIAENNLKIQTETESAKIKLYPNPVHDFITIELTKPSEIQLLQIDGKQILHTEAIAPTATLNIADLPQGIYLIRIANEKGIFTRKIVKL